MSTEIKQRGPDVAYTCVFLVGGNAFAYWVAFGFTRMTNQLSWVRNAWARYNIIQHAY